MAADEVKTADAEMKDAGEPKAEEGKEDAKDSMLKPKDEKKEVEEDAPADSRGKISADAVGVNTSDTTLNALPIVGGHFFTSLNEGAFGALLAGVRANVGVKAGRYMFEIKIVENSANAAAAKVNPASLVRVGVSLAGSSLLLADGSDSVYFDSEGFFVHGKTKKRTAQKFGKGQSVAVVLNLDSASPQANTISLFTNGKRVSEPQALPENLRGQPLFPTITYRNVTLQTTFGPDAKALPFTCRTLADAAADDVQVVSETNSSGKRDVVFPVGLPEKGYFDWVDAFVEAHPDYTELSDRKLAEWAAKSGLNPQAGGAASNDKPGLAFGAVSFVDKNVQRTLMTMAATSRRNFIVPELKSNLVAADRKGILSQFASSRFNKRAKVFVGEPNAQHKEKVQKLILAAKQAKADAEKEKKRMEAQRKKAEAARLKALEVKKKAAERARINAIKLKKGEPVEEDEPAVEEPEEKEDVEMEDDVKVELTDEEKQMTMRKQAKPDLDANVLSRAYGNFALPTSDEGFDEVAYEWQQETDCSKLLSEYILSMKRTQRVENITPGEWFKEESAKWEKDVKAWKLKAAEFKNPAKKKAMIAAKIAELKKAQEGEAAEPELPELDAGEIDTASVEDVTDIGNCQPLFANFENEDWILLSLRYELHALLLSWKKDINDSDRPSFTEQHMPFYYNKYFKKQFSPRNFGVNLVSEVVAFIKDTISINSDSNFFETNTSEDTPFSHFVKLTEEHRRDRARRVDAGDEGSLLKFPRQAAGGLAPVAAQPARIAPVARPAGGLMPGARPAATPVKPLVALKPVVGGALRPAGSVGLRPTGTAGLVPAKRPLTPTGVVGPASKAPKLVPK